MLARRREQEAVVSQAIADLEQRVRQRRRRMGEPEQQRALHADVRTVTDNWFVSAHLPITWEIPVIGRLGSLAKRALRIGLRWYINPIIDQQNDFNAAVARAFVRVTAQQEELAAAVARLEERLAQLEQRLPAEPPAPEQQDRT